MKKKFFLIGTLVAMSMSAMFVACNQNTPTNGCICTMTYEGQKMTERYSFEEMVDEMGVTTCSELQAYFPPIYSASCKAY